MQNSKKTVFEPQENQKLTLTPVGDCFQKNQLQSKPKTQNSQEKKQLEWTLGYQKYSQDCKKNQKKHFLLIDFCSTYPVLEYEDRTSLLKRKWEPTILRVSQKEEIDKNL